MLNHTSLPSIEAFAAFLDGNLSQHDMQQFSQLAAHDEALHQLMQANSVVDDTLNGFTDADLHLPANLVSTDFKLPEVPSLEDTSTLVSLSSDSANNMFVAACADDDVSMFSDMNQDEHSTMGEYMQDDSSLTTLDDDDLSGSFSDDIY